MPNQEEMVIKELRMKLEAHVRVQLLQPDKIAKSDISNIAKRAQLVQKSSTKATAKFKAWLVNRVQRLSQFPRRILPWHKGQMELMQRMREHMDSTEEYNSQLTSLAMVIQEQKIEQLTVFAELKGRTSKIEKEYSRLITNLSFEIRELRERSDNQLK
jgi:hypothetical protein